MTKQLEEDFEDGKIVIVDFWADWCPPCKTIAPILDNIAQEYADSVQLIKIDADKEPAVVNRFDVTSLPTLVFFNEARLPYDRIIGAAPKKKIVEKLELNQ